MGTTVPWVNLLNHSWGLPGSLWEWVTVPITPFDEVCTVPGEQFFVPLAAATGELNDTTRAMHSGATSQNFLRPVARLFGRSRQTSPWGPSFSAFNTEVDNVTPFQMRDELDSNRTPHADGYS